MRARLVTLSLCLSVLLVLPSQANEKPTPEYQKAIFAVVLTYWQDKKVDDAIKLSQDGIKAATELETAAKAQNHPAVVAAQAAIAGASSSGEIGAIGVCAPCHTAHRVRLPDGTYEIK
jgi:cytochrome c553